MKRTTKTLSCLLIATALTMAACGDRAESSKSSVRKGSGNGSADALGKLDASLPEADATLAGIWLDMTPMTHGLVTKTTYWNIDPSLKSMAVGIICESDNGASNTTAQGVTKIEAKKNDLLLKADLKDTKSFKMISGVTADCVLDIKAQKISYNLNGTVLEILSETNEAIAKLCPATIDATTKRPVAKADCQASLTTSEKANSEKATSDKGPTVKASDVKDAASTEILPTTEDDAQKLLVSEGLMADKAKRQAVSWTRNLPNEVDAKNKKTIQSSTFLRLGSIEGDDTYVLQKVCRYIGEKASSMVQINPKALLTGKRIRILEGSLEDKTGAKNGAPACELKLTAKEMSYSMSTDGKTLKTSAGEVFTALVKKSSSPETDTSSVAN